MSNTDSLFNSNIIDAGKNAIDATRGGDNTPAVIRIMKSLLMILLIVGAEGFRVIYRNNFGKKGINLTRVIICACCFGYLSYSAFTEDHFNFGIDDSSSTAISFYVVGILFAALSATMLAKGILSYAKAYKESPYSDYKGDSSFLGFLEDYGYRPSIIQNLAEPLYTLIIGILLYFYNPAGGVPIIFCALSLWFFALLDFIFGSSSINSMQKEMQAARANESITNQVSTD